MKILREGFPFIIPAFIAGAALVILSIIVIPVPLSVLCLAAGILSVVFSLFCMFFFRDPDIEITHGEGIILSPCNGTVMEICDSKADSGADSAANEKVIRVFLSIFSVHLQRAPVGGTVIDVAHKDGKFLAAWDPRAHMENEQNIFTIQSSYGTITVRQIAGLVARRCVSWVKAGDMLRMGDKIGMIKFSSQVDLHLPLTADVKVKPGDKTRAGITVIAKI